MDYPVIRQKDSRRPSSWIRPVQDRFHLACCDCSLVHDMDFRVVKSIAGPRVEFRVRRNERQTQQLRKRQIK